MAPRGRARVLLVSVASVVLAGSLLADVSEPQTASRVRTLQPVFELRGRDAAHDNGLLLLADTAAEGRNGYAMIPPLIQAAGVEAIGSVTVRYLLKLRVLWTPKIEDLVRDRTGKMAPLPLPIDLLTVHIPELGITATSTDVPRLGPSARFTVPFDVNAERVTEAYTRLSAQNLSVMFIFRFGTVETVEGSLHMSREEFLASVPSFNVAWTPPGEAPRTAGPLYRYEDIERRLGDVKYAAPKTQAGGQQFAVHAQKGIDDVLREWFEEARAGGPGERDALASIKNAPSAQHPPDPWHGIIRESYDRVFKRKLGPAPSLELLRFAARRPSKEFQQSMRVGFGAPPPPPTELNWRQVSRRVLELHVPCGTSPTAAAAGVRLPVAVAADQKIEIVPVSLTSFRGVPQSFRLDVGGVSHLAERASSGGASDVWAAIVRAAGVPQLSILQESCPRRAVDMSVNMAVYE